MPEPITLLLVDDHEILRVGLRGLFSHEPGIRVVGEADSVATAVKEAARLKPDVVLMDLRLPDGSGVDACREILNGEANAGKTRVLFLTSYEDRDAMLATVLAGGHGYLLKEIDGESLVRAVQMVASGQSILDPAAVRVVVDRLRAPGTPNANSAIQGLSAQEQRVAVLVAEGKTNKEIAAAMGLSDKTVKNYLSNVFHKLKITRRSQAASIVSSKAVQ